MVSAAETKKRRERLARLLQDEPDISDRAAGVKLGAHHSTIARDRLALAEREGVHRPPAPEHGNSRAVSHGATRAEPPAELYARFRKEVDARWPWLDDIRARTMANRLARLEQATEWLAQQRAMGLDRDPRGEPFPIVDRVERWMVNVERRVAEYDQEGRLQRLGPGGSVGALVGDLSALSTEERRQLLALLQKAIGSAPDVIIDGTSTPAQLDAGEESQ